eukprot:XP_011430236.2 PREDICTED: uncharacterized protein LOC105330314 [Crassostrea gigas]
MSSDDEQAYVVTSSNKLSVSPGGSSTESNNTSILGSSKGKRRHSATETEVSSDSTNSVKMYEKFKKKELLTSESSDCTVFSHSGSESPIALDEIPSRTSDWNEQVLPLLNIKVDLNVYEPHDLFNSGYVNFFMRKHHTKISGFIGYQARNAEQLHLLKQCLTLTFTDSVKVDCSVIEEIPVHKVIEMENELKCPEWTQNLMKNLGKFDSKHESTMIDFSHSLRLWLKQFVQQISLMVQKRKRSKPEEITEGMFQELFILFVKMFGTQISGYSNLQPFLIHLGDQTVSSIPDAIIYSPSCRDIENENSIAVIEIKKEYSKCEPEETERELRNVRKKSKTDHIPSKLKGQHVGEMLALLPSSVFGTHGIYGFLVQGTKVNRPDTT